MTYACIDLVCLGYYVRGQGSLMLISHVFGPGSTWHGKVDRLPLGSDFHCHTRQTTGSFVSLSLHENCGICLLFVLFQRHSLRISPVLTLCSGHETSNMGSGSQTWGQCECSFLQKVSEGKKWISIVSSLIFLR